MRHWTEGFDDDADESLVRPYTITGGRTAPERDDLALITLVTTVSDTLPEPGRGGPRRLQPEHREIFALCRRPLAVAEVAAALNLPVSVTKILIGDLIETGQLRSRPPMTFAHASGLPDMDILKAVRDGLREL
ncbi:DUF742 domain-containing protein [Nonomuraea sp. NPDC050783]|uniref:DUF742 domain-containing protein n=1 Tax=Nonomuraea sp. NPDC050783 TaxID=3154634 RepID=UPI003467647F